MKILTIVLVSAFVIMLSGCSEWFNDPPVIEKITPSKAEVEPGGEVAINVIANDPDGDEITYNYEVSAGEIIGSGSIVIWIAPEVAGPQFVKVVVEDDDRRDEESVTIWVTADAIPQVPGFDFEMQWYNGIFGDWQIRITQEGNPVQGADVVVENCNTGWTRSSVTDANGWASWSGTEDEIAPAHVIKVDVTYNGTTSTWYFQGWTNQEAEPPNDTN